MADLGVLGARLPRVHFAHRPAYVYQGEITHVGYAGLNDATLAPAPTSTPKPWLAYVGLGAAALAIAGGAWWLYGKHGRRPGSFRPNTGHSEERLTRAQKRQARMLRRDQKKRLQARLREERAAGRSELKTIQTECREARERLKFEREQLVTRCRSSRAVAKEQKRERVEQAKRALEHWQEMEDWHRSRERELRPKRATLKETRAEAYQQVEYDLPPDLIPIWRKVQKHIKPGPRETLTEAFEHWVSDNADEVAAMQAGNEESGIEDLVAQYRQEEQQRYEEYEEYAAGAAE